MKRVLLIGTLLLVASMQSSFGQVKTGIVEYEEVIKFEIKLEGEMAAMMRDMPKERRENKVLYFNEEESLFTKSETEVAHDMSGFSGEGRGMRMRMGGPGSIVYTDLDNKEIVEQREFMTRMFLITTDIPETAWKITGKQKIILDYPCMEATTEDTAGVVTQVWFTPLIPVQSGPSKFGNLPGLVLEANVNDSTMMVTATSINTEVPDKDILKKPKEGKKVTQEEFDKIVMEKLEEMGVEGGAGGHGGGGTFMIRIHQ